MKLQNPLKAKGSAKVPASPAPVPSLEGRGVMSYFMPVLLVGGILLLFVTVLSQRIVATAYDDQHAQVMEASAAAVTHRLVGTVRGYRQAVGAVARWPALAESLQQGAALAPVVVPDLLRQSLPGNSQLFIYSAAMIENGAVDGAQLGYAGVDLIGRTLVMEKMQAAEIHQLQTAQPYLAIAAPVITDQRVIGVLLVGYPLNLFSGALDSSRDYPGWIRIEQVSGGGSYVVAATLGKGTEPPEKTLPVKDTLLQVAYRTLPVGWGESGLSLFAGTLLVALLLLLGIVWRQNRSLDQDLKEDMATTLQLVESLLKRKGTSVPKPRLQASAPVLLLFAKYAQTVYSNTPKQGSKQAVETLVADDDDEAAIARKARVFGNVLPAEEGSITVGGSVPREIFRAYDIRGIAGETLNEDLAQLIGLAVGSLAQERKQRSIVVGRDARLSSPSLSEALIAGIRDSGCNVVYLGEVPTPLVYFASHVLETRSAVMVTGSHNPPDYNGMKIVIDGEPLAEEELQGLYKRIVEGSFRQGKGRRDNRDLAADYIARVEEDVQFASPMKVIIDAGNGVAGALSARLLRRLGCEVDVLFSEPDGHFPNHHPDPGNPDNLKELSAAVRAQQADLGIAFDGDGDRLGVVNEMGEVVINDLVLMLLAADVLERHPGGDIIYDVKSSKAMASFILSHGGRPIMWQTGHTRIKSKMRKTGALLGGEFSGHLFIKERWYGFDDAIYAAARLIEILGVDGRPASECFAELPGLAGSPEYHLSLAEGEAVELMPAIRNEVAKAGANLVEIDGLRVEFPDSWGLVRPSNTTPSLNFRFEGNDAEALEAVKDRFRAYLTAVRPGVEVPF